MDLLNHIKLHFTLAMNSQGQ